MIKINCMGYNCPLPVIMLREKYPLIMSGKKILLVTDHSLAVQNIEYYCSLNNFEYKSEEVLKGVWEITVSK